MSTLSEKISNDINILLKEDSLIDLDDEIIEEIINKLVDISMKIETKQSDIESSSKEFQNYLYEKI